ncbi:unnamed protein product [Effrenium voratum]|nr:unnamed protein product [Effrenium voratum]
MGFNAGMAAGARAAAWRHALQLLQVATCRRLQPTLPSFLALMEAHSTSWPRALHLMEGENMRAPLMGKMNGRDMPWENAFALVRTSQQQAPSLSRDWPLPVGPWQRVCLVTAESADEGRRGFFSCLAADQLPAAANLLRLGVEPPLALRGALLARYEAKGLWKPALALIQEWPQGDAKMYNSLSCLLPWRHALCADFDFSAPSVLPRLRWAQGLALLARLAAHGTRPAAADWDAARSTQPWFFAVSLARLHGLGAGLRSCRRDQRWQSGTKLLAQAAQGALVPNAICCSTAIAAVQEFRHWEWATEMLHAWRARGFEANEHCFNAMISSCDKARAWPQALQAMLVMRLVRLAPDEYSFAATSSGCEKAGRWRWALHVSPSGSEAGRTAALRACAQCGMWRSALDLFADLSTTAVVLVDPLLRAISAAATALSSWKLREWLRQVELEAARLCENPRSGTFLGGRKAERARLMALELLRDEGHLSAELLLRCRRFVALSL